MKILAVGGGSGGHVTPVVAVLDSLKNRHPHVEIRFWCDRKFEPLARQKIHDFDASIRVDTIISGKFRRYHSLPVWRQVFFRPFSIVLPNIRDMFLNGIGLVQSVYRLARWRPDVVFCKGGFVCVPVGLAAYMMRIPIVLHDSDAHPGLANRILARFAQTIATGTPQDDYVYPTHKTHYIGVPVDHAFTRKYSPAERERLKVAQGVASGRPLVVVTGGGLGAQQLNDAIIATLSHITTTASVVLISGVQHYADIAHQTRALKPSVFQVHAFVGKGMAEILAAADVVVTRAGATTILELAALAKPTILVPNPYLTGGHQLKNAAVYASADAVEVIDEGVLSRTPQKLAERIVTLVQDTERQQVLARNFQRFAMPNAADDMAALVVGAIRCQSSK